MNLQSEPTLERLPDTPLAFSYLGKLVSTSALAVQTPLSAVMMSTIENECDTYMTNVCQIYFKTYFL